MRAGTASSLEFASKIPDYWAAFQINGKLFLCGGILLKSGAWDS